MVYGHADAQGEAHKRTKMKIGILTFHWCYNYGAVIQAWALQTHLSECGHEAFIINYEPTRTRLPWWTVALRQRSFRRFLRDSQFRAFRKHRLCETLRVLSVTDIATLGLDAVIVGSDQVWNVQYLTWPSGKYNSIYFLHGDLSGIRKIAYAASIGHGGWGDYRWREDLLSDIRDFDAVSVREYVAQDELTSFGIKSTVVPDPSLLVKLSAYDQIIKPPNENRPYVFSYLLSEYERVRPMVDEVCGIKKKKVHIVTLSRLGDSKLEFLAPERWLSAIRYADFVITDSFHGTALSIVFNVPFAAVLKSDKTAMNARITGLLDAVGLNDRIATSSSGILNLMDKLVDWNSVNDRLERMRSIGKEWLVKNLRI